MHKLDNPVWNSLNEIHESRSIEYQSVKFYEPAYCPFGGFTDAAEATKGITTYAKLLDNFFVVGEKPLLDKTVELNKGLICKQMLLENEIDLEISEQIIELEKTAQRQELFELVDLVTIKQ